MCGWSEYKELRVGDGEVEGVVGKYGYQVKMTVARDC